MSDGGKGDTYRPIKDRSLFDANWDRIFAKKREAEFEAALEQARQMGQDAKDE